MNKSGPKTERCGTPIHRTRKLRTNLHNLFAIFEIVHQKRQGIIIKAVMKLF